MLNFRSLRPTMYLGQFVLALVTLIGCMDVKAQPSQTPLLASQAGAKPNLMITLDNSGSMSFNFHESYGVASDRNDIEMKRCPSNRWSILTGAWIQGGMADFYNENRCYADKKFSSSASTNEALSYFPKRYLGAWSAQRSADVNPVYYNPRVRYFPRVDARGENLIPADGVVWISNQTSAVFQYKSFRKGESIRTRHSMYAEDLDADGNLLGHTDYTAFAPIPTYIWRTPTHVAYTATNSSTLGFTYSYCSEVLTISNLQVGCTNWADVTVRPNSTANVSLPSGHGRTDCTGNVCTNAQEVANIMNWYRYYAFRAPAVVTAIGQAIANPENDKKLRFGYLSINRRDSSTVSAIDQTPGVTTDNTGLLRGVRLHERGSADTQQIYTWLYDQDGTKNRNSEGGVKPSFNGTGERRHAPYGATPLHNAVSRVADYFRYETNAQESPWSTNPRLRASDTNPEMSCRRSFNLLFSDGAWNKDTSTIPNQDFDNTNGPEFNHLDALGVTEKFQYFARGINTVSGRRQYTPFPSTGTGGLADLTAQFFWHLDLRPDNELKNNVKARAGQPTFWQNMATYTVGYLIRPTGDVPGNNSGLTFDQIKNYQASYARDGYESASKPAWATGNMNSVSDQERIDDFIQAGFTGGGKGFSARTADDVRSIFDSIIRDISDASGEDAGVAVSTAATDLTTIKGRLKYGVSYSTLENTGEIEARELDAQGNEVSTRWIASAGIPEPAIRRVFTMSGTATPISLAGTLTSLPADVRSALKSGPDAVRVPDDARFVNYLRGLDPVTDTSGVLFRQRTSKLGAMVNPPSIFMGGERDFAYDVSGTVAGGNSYLQYADAKRALPPSLFVSTNAGMMHAFNASEGNEMAAFMPRRSLRRMLNYAKAEYRFQYTLDGPLSEHDIYDGVNWNHVAVGTGGRGEPLLYAVRSPLNRTGSPNRTPGQSDFLWESGPDLINTGSLQMGHMTNPVRSGQTENGEWVMVVNNGHYNGANDGTRSGLVVLNAMTGAVIRTLALPAAYSAGRGLSGVTLVRDSKKRIVAAYAGDANGNLWRFNLRGLPETWGVSYDKPLFTTPNNRPIYGSPAWQVHPRGGAIVVVATGMLLEDNDLGDTSLNEAIHGIWDPTVVGGNDVTSFTPVKHSDLLSQSVLQGNGVKAGAGTFFQASRNQIDWSVHRGWTMPLGHTYKGERSLDHVRNLGISVIVATTVVKAPENPDAEMCSSSELPVNYIYILNALDGTSTRAFDTDGDDRLDNVSVALVAGGGYSRGMAVVNTLKDVELTESIRIKLGVDEGVGESSPNIQKCSPVRVRLLGTESGSFSAGVTCDVAGWSRSQYQLSRPPAN